MRASALKYTVLSVIASLVTLILLFIPFHAFLTVWGSQLVGHYTALRLWKEAILLLCALGMLYLLATDGKIRSYTLTRRLVWLILLYGFINLIWGLVALKHHAVTRKALGYGLVVNLRFLAFFLVTWAVALRNSRLRAQWQKLVLLPAVIVVLFGLLQIFILPNDVLRHVGYGSATIYPFETINHNAHYVRIISTLRGANPLGAYLLVPISVLTVLILAGKRSWPRLGLLAGSLIVLFFSFSRSAWVGVLLSLGVIAALELHSRLDSRLLMLAVTVVAVLIGAGFILRHSSRFENIIFHTQTQSTIKATSDQGHAQALKTGLKDIVREPLGRGPGTAGPASVYNHGQARIAENYYIQIGQELGWLGLAAFLLINAGVAYLLWLRRDDPLALSLLASLVGLSFINLLSHAWTDDTLAYVWWGLAGIAMVREKPKHERQAP